MKESIMARRMQKGLSLMAVALVLIVNAVVLLHVWELARRASLHRPGRAGFKLPVGPGTPQSALARGTV
jgi:hypothetical protein